MEHNVQPMAKNKRVIQSMIVEAWKASAMSKADLARKLTGIPPSKVGRYVDGHADVYLRERTAEAMLAALKNGLKGPKQRSM
jgi:hypothetical protein